jgi:hypothetical protein
MAKLMSEGKPPPDYCIQAVDEDERLAATTAIHASEAVG